ncbi:MAG: hypothetical protein L0196_07545 [candidate division Zixibacteria bacterium]|nr:hypothetical protein [candidate division Zixibacteria bacterium]
MKTILVVAFLLILTGIGWAQPDARDSIILESKTVAPGAGSPYMTVKVFITNKDSLAYLVLTLKEVTTIGGAYGTLRRNASGILTFGSVINSLTPSFRIYSATNFSRYDGQSPDSFIVAAGYDGSDLETEPPNAVRKAVWEIKFDTIRGGGGTFELDSAMIAGQPGCYFTSLRPIVDLPVNFVKGVITVAPKGDFNLDLAFSAADIVLLINCVFQSMPPPGGASCDVNCDGQASGADVVLEVQAVFLQEPFPC